jgi:methylornithine synthase
MVSPGVLSKDGCAALTAAGADWYACYQETHSRGLFRRLRPGQDFDEREAARRIAREQGLLIEDGILSGVGETPEDILRSLEHFRASGADQVRVMGFVPDGPIPLGPRPEAAPEVVIIALLRLLFPDRLIPASLDVEGLAGLGKRLAAGANVVTSIIPPGQGLQGVARSALDIEEGNRTVPRVLEVIEGQGLQPGTPEEFSRVMTDARNGRVCVST